MRGLSQGAVAETGRQLSLGTVMNLIGSSCVVVANRHNPSILNPDWLSRMKIVDAEWETAEPIIVTPAFARCAYSNDVEIALDPGKLTVNLSRDKRELSSELPKIAGRYVRTLKHVPYKHQGNNFRFSADMPNVVSALKNGMIRPGSWSLENMSRIRTVFRYSCEDSKINLSVESDVAKPEGNNGRNVDVLILDFNYHRECEGSDSVLKAIDCWSDDYGDAVRRTGEIVKGMERK